MKTLRKNVDFSSFETFSLLHQVTQLLKGSVVRLELKRGNSARFHRQIVTFIALPFPFSSHLKIWSFRVVVVPGRLRNVQKSVLHLQSCCFSQINLLSSRRSRCLCRCRIVKSLLKETTTATSRERQPKQPLCTCITFFVHFTFEETVIA